MVYTETMRLDNTENCILRSKLFAVYVRKTDGDTGWISEHSLVGDVLDIDGVLAHCIFFSSEKMAEKMAEKVKEIDGVEETDVTTIFINP